MTYRKKKLKKKRELESWREKMKKESYGERGGCSLFSFCLPGATRPLYPIFLEMVHCVLQVISFNCNRHIELWA